MDSYKKNGYIICENVFTIKEIEIFKKIILEYLDKNKCLKNSGGVSVPDFIKIKELDIISNMRNHPKIHEKLKLIFNGNNYRFCGHNDIGIDRTVGWHKDKLNNIYAKYQIHDIWKEHNDQKHEIVKVLIYLQDHSTNNHGLKIVPGSHLKNNNNQNGSFYLHPKIGDVVIFDQRITHRGTEQKSNENRILISFGFGQNNIFTDEFEKGTIQRQNDQNNKI